MWIALTNGMSKRGTLHTLYRGGCTFQSDDLMHIVSVSIQIEHDHHDKRESLSHQSRLDINIGCSGFPSGRHSHVDTARHCANERTKAKASMIIAHALALDCGRRQYRTRWSSDEQSSNELV